MNIKFMRVKKYVIPTLTMVIIASQLMGCAVANRSELLQMLNESRQIEIEIATPISQEQGKEQVISWTQLDQLTTYKEFRNKLDELMGIVSYNTNSKNGIAYVDLEGNQNGNNTLYNAFMNKKFVENFIDDMGVQMDLDDEVLKLYVDATEENAMYAAINAYWNLLPDADPNYFNGDSTLNRLEAMSLIARANNQVVEDFGDDAFSLAVGDNDYTDYASLVQSDSYLDTASGSLDNLTAVGTITRGEYIYMLIHNIFGSSRLDSVDTKKATFNDCKNGGDIASQQKFSTDKKMWKSYELKYALDNPEKGCPEAIFKALVAAQELGIIKNETRWDEGLTKTEAIALYCDMLQAYTRVNGYAVDQLQGNGGIDETDPYTQQLQEAEQEREENDANLNESTGIEIVEDLDIRLYAQSNCNGRSGDGVNYDELAKIEKGTNLHITGRTSNDWYRVEWPSAEGEVVYVSASLLGTNNPYQEQINTVSEEEIQRIQEEVDKISGGNGNSDNGFGHLPEDQLVQGSGGGGLIDPF